MEKSVLPLYWVGYSMEWSIRAILFQSGPVYVHLVGYRIWQALIEFAKLCPSVEEKGLGDEIQHSKCYCFASVLNGDGGIYVSLVVQQLPIESTVSHVRLASSREQGCLKLALGNGRRIDVPLVSAGCL